jgi:hypothetical protein
VLSARGACAGCSAMSVAASPLASTRPYSAATGSLKMIEVPNSKAMHPGSASPPPRAPRPLMPWQHAHGHATGPCGPRAAGC